jgi:hypothetical protein
VTSACGGARVVSRGAAGEEAAPLVAHMTGSRGCLETLPIGQNGEHRRQAPLELIVRQVQLLSFSPASLARAVPESLFLEMSNAAVTGRLALP